MIFSSPPLCEPCSRSHSARPAALPCARQHPRDGLGQVTRRLVAGVEQPVVDAGAASQRPSASSLSAVPVLASSWSYRLANKRTRR